MGILARPYVLHENGKRYIVFNPATEELKIIDFGISSILSCENPIICNPNILEGTLAYISSEQTGRMNRLVDYRSDFYS
jgi:serine/threonine protein kinase